MNAIFKAQWKTAGESLKFEETLLYEDWIIFTLDWRALSLYSLVSEGRFMGKNTELQSTKIKAHIIYTSPCMDTLILPLFPAAAPTPLFFLFCY